MACHKEPPFTAGVDVQRDGVAVELMIHSDGKREHVWSRGGRTMSFDEVDRYLRPPELEPGTTIAAGTILDISVAEVRLRCFALTSSDQPFSKRITDAARYAKFAMAAADGGREDRVACLEALVSDEVANLDEDFASKMTDRATALAFFVEAQADA